MMKQKLIRGLAMLAVILTLPAQAKIDVLIGKGKGIVWEGLPFNTTLRTTNPVFIQSRPDLGVISIGDQRLYSCTRSDRLVDIAGYKAIPIARGLGLLPRAVVSATYTKEDDSVEQMQGTVGLPETKVDIKSTNPDNNRTVLSSSGYAWCLSPHGPSFYYFKSGTLRTVTFSGNWVIVADGTQAAGYVPMEALSAATYLDGGALASKEEIIMEGMEIRISTLECLVGTLTSINFGAATRDTTVDAELAKMTLPLTINCNQGSAPVTANVNVQLRALSGLHNVDPAKLSLVQKGGYITGEIAGVTGTGTCGASTGVTFNGEPIKVGAIDVGESSKVFNNPITWRLCSGGADLPSGRVNASAELLVTYN